MPELSEDQRRSILEPTPHGTLAIIPRLSSTLFALNLALPHISAKAEKVDDDAWAFAIYPPLSVPKPRNRLALWNGIFALLIILAYGMSIAQLPVLDASGSLAWGD